MGFLGRGGKDPGPANYLKEAERFLGEAEKYARPGRNQSIQAAGASYQIALDRLESAEAEIKTQRDRERYEAVRNMAQRTGRSIVNSASSSITAHLAGARKSIETGDRIAGYQVSLEAGGEPPEVKKYLQLWRESNPEAAAEEDRRKQKDAEMRAEMNRILKSSPRVYGNAGYSSASFSISSAEEEVGAAEKVAGAAQLSDVQPGLKSARDAVKKARAELESREKS